MSVINEIIGAVAQIIVFALIPFIVYLVTNKTTKGFFSYIGLKKSTKRANILAIAACLLFVIPPLLLTYVSDDFKEIMLAPSSVTGKFSQMDLGLNSAFLLLMIAIFKTAFAEEILFRGFIAKRLVSVLGYLRGNLLQAFIFGIIHTGLFALTTQNTLFLAVIFIVPSIGAFVSVYLNEKLANGSIIPGWISHGLANILSYGIVGFLI